MYLSLEQRTLRITAMRRDSSWRRAFEIECGFEPGAETLYPFSYNAAWRRWADEQLELGE